MPRPKGSKNKPALTLDEQIAQVNAEIVALQDQLKEKKTELKNLSDAKANEDKQRLMDLVTASGKSVDEIIAKISSAEQ